MYQRITVDRRDRAFWITLNRPEQMNCWDTRLNDELLAALESVADDPAIRMVVFTGAGRAFCAGGDIEEFQSGVASDAAAYISNIVRKSHEVVLQVRKIGKITIAAVNGVATGSGFNLMLACDFKIAVASARFSQRFVRVGLSPDTGGTFFLPQIVGFTKATELLMTGDFVTAEEALSLCLVNKVVGENELNGEVEALIARLGKSAFQALVATKRLINQSTFANLATHLEAEREAMVWSAKTRDFAEGVQAFLEKRPPQFTGV